MLGAGEDPGKTWEDQEMPRGCPGDVRGRDGGVGTVINLTDPLALRTRVVPQRGNTYLRASEEQGVVETCAGNYDFITRMFGAFIPRKFGEFPRKSLVSIVIDKS